MPFLDDFARPFFTGPKCRTNTRFNFRMKAEAIKYRQESIPAGSVPPACQLHMFWWLTLGVSSGVSTHPWDTHQLGTNTLLWYSPLGTYLLSTHSMSTHPLSTHPQVPTPKYSLLGTHPSAYP